jgi:hypothetical protein
LTKTPISPYLAMTGEVTLRGVVMPVGGIREKLTAASRAGIRKVLLPHRNRKDVESDLPKKVRDELEIKYVKTVWEAMEAAFGNKLFENPRGPQAHARDRRLATLDPLPRLLVHSVSLSLVCIVLYQLGCLECECEECVSARVVRKWYRGEGQPDAKVALESAQQVREGHWELSERFCQGRQWKRKPIAGQPLAGLHKRSV